MFSTIPDFEVFVNNIQDKTWQCTVGISNQTQKVRSRRELVFKTNTNDKRWKLPVWCLCTVPNHNKRCFFPRTGGRVLKRGSFFVKNAFVIKHFAHTKFYVTLLCIAFRTTYMLYISSDSDQEPQRSRTGQRVYSHVYVRVRILWE